MGKKEPDLDAQRNEMVRDQLKRRGITDERVLNAMRSVPRHLFVPQDMQRMAYWDGPLSIGSGQTISQPYIVALMTQLLRLRGDEKVLEVGCGSGYQAAVLSALVEQVISIERHDELAASARLRLQELGYHNVKVLTGDGTLGVPTEAPFDAAIITAAAPAIPLLLKDQLQEGGRIVAPVGDRGRQVLEIHSRQGSRWKVDYSIPVMFVPLIGKHGWDKGDWGYSTW